MLQTIRDRATGWIAYTIVALICIPFALWGINAYFTEGGPQDVAEVDGVPISLQQFQRAYEQQRQRLQSLMGANFNPDLLDGERLKRDVLQQLVDENLLVLTARNQGLRVSDQQLSEALRSIEAFQQDGVFDPELYQRILRIQGYTSVGFEENLRNALITDQLRQGLVTSSVLTRAELDNYIQLMNQERELSYVVLPLEAYRDKVDVDETAIETYFQENKDRFMSPERVRVNYIELKLEDMAANISVSEQDLRIAYEEQIAGYTQAEERSASHVLVPITVDADAAEKDKAREQAQAIFDEISSDAKTFQQAMEQAQNSDALEGGELGVIAEGMMESTFEDALFALEAVEDISEPVQSSFGFHIIRLDKIAPAKVKSFEEVRDELEQAYRLRQAESRFYDAAETLANLSYEHPDSLEPAAQALELEIAESAPFGRGGGGGVASYPKVILAAFSEDVLTEGRNSDPIEVTPDHIVVVQLLSHEEARPLSLEEARDDVVDQFKDRQARKALEEDAEALLERAQQGESLEELTAEFGGELKQPGLVGRRDTKVGGAILTEAFRLPMPKEGVVSVAAATLANGDRAIAEVSKVVPGKEAEMDEAERTALAQRLAGQTGNVQFQAYLDSRRQQVDVVTFDDRL